MEIINILGINVHNLSKKQALVKIEEFLSVQKQRLLATVNPEIILAANKDKEFFDILNKADLALPDGIGLKITAWLIGANLERITGADLVKDILELAETQDRRVVIFNWRNGLSGELDIKNALVEKYSGLSVLVINIERETVIPVEKLARIKEFQPEIVFCTLGAPFQEKFIFYNIKNWPSARIGMGVGGSFDFLTGKLPRAPFWLRKIGLEWLWRLIKQPRRWKRIYNAVIVFPIKFILWRFKKIAKIVN